MDGYQDTRALDLLDMHLAACEKCYVRLSDEDWPGDLPGGVQVYVLCDQAPVRIVGDEDDL
jgi:hypothetical protein